MRLNERSLGKGEVESSILSRGTRKIRDFPLRRSPKSDRNEQNDSQTWRGVWEIGGSAVRASCPQPSKLRRSERFQAHSCKPTGPEPLRGLGRADARKRSVLDSRAQPIAENYR